MPPDTITMMRLAMKAMEAGLAVIAADGTQESLLDLMQSREELYDLLGYDPDRVAELVGKYLLGKAIDSPFQ